jgi:nitrogen fixation protein NifB
MPSLGVVGIAGPGEPLANDETFQTLVLLQEEFPDLRFCISTNGLNLPHYLDQIRELGVEFVTITINAVDPGIASRINDLVIYEGRTIRGFKAAEKLLENQLDGIQRAASAGLIVKVNSVFIPAINGDHIETIADTVRDLGAYVFNIMPLIPVPGTRFEKFQAPTHTETLQLRNRCERKVKQIKHCRQCRADAVGLLQNDREAEFAHLSWDEINSDFPEPAIG